MIASLLLLAVLPKHGALLLAGGGDLTSAVYDSLAEICGGKDKAIIILAQTMANPEDGQSCLRELSTANFSHVTLESGTSFSDSSLLGLEDRLASCAAVYVPEGDQALFVKRFGLEWCQRVFPKLLDQGVNWFGNGGGAMLAGDRMFYGDKLGEGFSLFDGLVDTHYFSQHHELRLRNAYFSCRLQYGFGLDVGEYVVVRDNLIEKKVGLPQVFLRE